MDNDNIEILQSENIAVHSSCISLPTNFITMGEVEQDSIKVYIKQDVYRKIEKYSKEDISKEVGSILIGNCLEENGKNTVVISNYIEARFTDASAATLTFTHKTWDYVYKEKDKNYPDKTIVGWQHTHPGYGIFLSNYDVFIQENFFNLPWQLAYVVDPIADTRGFFEWKNGKISKLTGFYVYDEAGESIKLSEKAKPNKKSFPSSTAVLSFLLLIAVIFAVFFGVEKNNMENKLRDISAENQLSDKQEKTNETDASDTETFIVYTVKKNEGLEIICQRHRLDYADSIEKIMKINGITDVNKIYAGQKIYLPVTK